MNKQFDFEKKQEYFEFLKKDGVHEKGIMIYINTINNVMGNIEQRYGMRWQDLDEEKINQAIIDLKFKSRLSYMVLISAIKNYLDWAGIEGPGYTYTMSLDKEKIKLIVG